MIRIASREPGLLRYQLRMLADPDGVLRRPCGDIRCAVLVLAGSSGRVETDRVGLLSEHGAAAASIRWFGGPAQPPGICEIPLETFTPALDMLAGLHDHLAVIGTSKGAEAALLLAASDRRIRAVAAFAPTSVVWANVGPGLDGLTVPQRSSWTFQGRPLPFVPYNPGWRPDPAARPPAYRELYQCSLLMFADRVADATIPVERIDAEVLLAAGGDDQVWPSVLFADQITARRAAHGRATQLVTHRDAGHRIHLSGEPPLVEASPAMARGGNSRADSALGHETWRHLGKLLDLQPGAGPSR